MTQPPRPESLLPLTAVAFEILLTLSDGDAHGYHVMQEVERRTNGAITLHPADRSRIELLLVHLKKYRETA